MRRTGRLPPPPPFPDRQTDMSIWSFKQKIVRRLQLQISKNYKQQVIKLILIN